MLLQKANLPLKCASCLEVFVAVLVTRKLQLGKYPIKSVILFNSDHSCPPQPSADLLNTCKKFELLNLVLLVFIIKKFTVNVH